MLDLFFGSDIEPIYEQFTVLLRDNKDILSISCDGAVPLHDTQSIELDIVFFSFVCPDLNLSLL